MIVKGIIETIEDNGYAAKVRIPMFHKASNASNPTLLNNLPIARICALPGCLPNYNLGDIVYIGFEQDETDQPIILGLLYRENNNDNSTSNFNAQSLTVELNTKLSNDTLIGDIKFKELELLYNKTLQE